MICLGGNLATAMPDPDVIFAAMRKLELVVHMATKLNRSHLLLAKNSYLLPVLGRTEKDRQASGSQSITVEDSMSMVHVSRGTLPNSKVPWEALVADYARIRDAIASVFPAFKDYNTRIQQPGGFRLYNAASERQWNTPNGRAQFIIMPGINEDPCGSPHHELVLITLRSHDQYNTTLYGLNDRYRGVTGRRDVLFLNAAEAERRELRVGDKVNVIELDADGGHSSRRLDNLTVVVYDMAPGSAATYYPEANKLMPLDSYDHDSGVPAYKSVPVALERCA